MNIYKYMYSLLADSVWVDLVLESSMKDFLKRILCVTRGGGEHFKIVWERRESEKKSMWGRLGRKIKRDLGSGVREGVLGVSVCQELL